MRGADLTIGLGVVALGVALLLGTGEIGAGAGFDRIGPRAVPYVVAAGLLGFGVLLVARRGERGAEKGVGHPPPLHWRPLAYLGLALILSLLLLERAGFVVATSLQFVLAARAFHSRRPARDAGIGLLLAVVVYAAFARGLGLSLPTGLLEGLL